MGASITAQQRKEITSRTSLHSKYAEAVSLYASTDLTEKEIAELCGLSRTALSQYLNRHQRALMLRRHGIKTDGANPHEVKILQAGRQSAKAHAKYKDAVAACQSMDYIRMNVSQIARAFNVTPTGLANFMRIHYEDVMPHREQIRQEMGIADNTHRGISNAAKETYAEAVEMYRSTNMTLPEIALRCHVSERGLSQHLRFYHKNILQEKDLQRKQATTVSNKPRGAMLGNGHKNQPSAKVVMKYSAALALYKSTMLTQKEIVERTGVPAQGFRFYLHKWHKQLVFERAGIEASEGDNIKISSQRTRLKTVAAKYAVAIQSLRENPRPVAVVAREYGYNPETFRDYLHKYEPELMSQFSMTRSDNGRTISPKAQNKYAEAIRLYATTTATLKSIAIRFGINPISLSGYIHRHCPKVSAQHKALLR